MGAAGGGIYDSDFARDLKATINGILRTPLSDDEIFAELWAMFGNHAGEVDALDYWLVLADQLERRSLRRQEVFERAIAIVADGEDIAVLKSLEAGPKVLARRRKETAQLVERLQAPRPQKNRRPLRKPMPLLFARGEALSWPTDKGQSINPYIAEDQLWKLGGFKRDGWGFGIVTDAGLVFEVLSFYAVQVLKWRRPERPSPELAAHCPRADHFYGTMNELHLKRAGIERIGRVPDAAMGPPPAPAVAQTQARRAVLMDISMTGALGIDAWNSWVWPGPKFAVPAPSGRPFDPNEPDQRPAPTDVG